VAIVFGPENAAVSEGLVYEAAKDANAKSYARLFSSNPIQDIYGEICRDLKRTFCESAKGGNMKRISTERPSVAVLTSILALAVLGGHFPTKSNIGRRIVRSANPHLAASRAAPA
jgi:hypothetical protein